MDVMFYEVFREEARVIKKYLPPLVRAKFTPHTIQENKDSLCPCPLISIRTQSQIPLSWATSLKGVLARTTGHDLLQAYRNKAFAHCKRGYLPHYCSRAVAEQACLMMLALFRKLPAQTAQMPVFHRDNLTGQECLNKNLLVVGVGRIGSEIADIGKGLGMQVRGVDIKPQKAGIDYVSLQEGIRWAQVIVCALPLTSKTQGLFHYAALKKAKHPLFFINVARGEISPFFDLERLLKEKVVVGLGLDVYENEDTVAGLLRVRGGTKNSTIRLVKRWQKRKNVIMTPHNAFNTEEALERKALQSAEAVKMFLQRQTFPHIVPEE